MLGTMYKNSIGAIVSLIAFVVSIYVVWKTPAQPGCNLYFLLPLFYAVMAISCKEIFKYHEGAFGLKCFFIVSFIRYVVLPWYTCFVGSFGKYSVCSADAYRYSIFVSVLEIIVSFLVIKKFYPSIYQKQYYLSRKKNVFYYNDLGFGGLVLLLFMVAVVVMRGHLNAIIDMTRFLVVSEKFDDTMDYWTYEIWAIQLFFAFVTVVVTSYFQKREHKKSSWLNVVLPLICAFLSCSIILTNNRMTMVYYALCGLCILNCAFPKKQKIISSIMIGVMFTVIVSFTLMKNFGINVTDSGGAKVSEDQGAEAISAYVCGVDNIAHSYEMYQLRGDEFSFNTIVAEVVRFTMPLRLPGLMPASYRNEPTTIDLATMGSEMVSVAGETVFWGSPILGWLIDMIAVFIIVRLLVYFDIRTKLEFDLGKRYVYSWLSVLYGIFMCYAIQTIWNNTTYIPLYLTCAIWINSRFRRNRTQIPTQYEM